MHVDPVARKARVVNFETGRVLTSTISFRDALRHARQSGTRFPECSFEPAAKVQTPQGSSRLRSIDSELLNQPVS